jgi:ribosomal protein L37E
MSSRQFNNVLTHTKSKKNHLTCVVCGSTARGYNFNAITCMSCKIFFRRNALTGIVNLF